MKKVLRIGVVMAIATLMVSVFAVNTSKAQGSVSLQVFYDELQPYGTWMQHNSYGYVWIPRVDRGFTPYASNGYWVNTEYGNTWVSDYSWGWAPFHYGRWFYDDFNGWIWVPDTEWAPAWVTWRSGGGYYGWAPLMPGFGINVSFNYYNRIPHRYWNFVPYQYITYRTLHYHCVSRPQVVNIINNTTIVTHNYTDNRRRTYFTGPTRSEMERNGRQRVEVYKVSDRNRPGRSDIDRGSVSFYKPEIDNSDDARKRSMPSRFVRTDQKGNREMVDTKRGAPVDFNDRKNDNIRGSQGENFQRDREPVNRADERSDFSRPQRSQPLERQSENDDFERFKSERQNTNKVEPNNYNQRREQLERQSAPIKSRPSEQSNQRGSEQFSRPDNDLRKAPAQQPQRMPQVERQNTNRYQQPNQNSVQRRSTVTPNNNRSSMSQREQQIRSGSSNLPNKQPTNSGGVKRESGSVRKGN